MKAYYKQPEREQVKFVKMDPDVEDYEIWILTATCLGSAQRLGTQRIACDGQQFSNLSSAARYLLTKANKHELAAKQSFYVNKERSKHPFTGLQMVEKELWSKFCRARQLDVTDTDAMKRTYYLNRKEMQELGLKPPTES